MNKRSLLVSLIFILPTLIAAAIELPAIVSSNMVLQRSTTVKVWGWADAGERVTIETSWSNKKQTTKADSDGKWQTDLETNASKAPQTITIKGRSSEVKLENILFGEVWLCSGQSNMEMPVRGNIGQPISGSVMAIAKSRNPNLRLFKVGRSGAGAPTKDVVQQAAWSEATPASVAGFSAIGYFFGQQLQEILDVPVGLINTSYGASTVQAWMSKEALHEYQDFDPTGVDFTKRPNKTPTALFNAMLSPLIPYTIKGGIWYQGEGNRLDPVNYTKLFPAMIKDWRTRWGHSNFPFYFTQIAPFAYGKPNGFSGFTNTAFMREAQLQCVDLVPNSGIAITLDVGDVNSIHPPKKKPVADRLLFNALHLTYGIEQVDHAGPVFESQEIKGDEVIVRFKNAENGLYVEGNFKGFEIAGADKVFYPAEARLANRKELVLKSAQVPNPVAVRYGWQNWFEGNFYDGSLLPASSFRTDNWGAEEATRAKEQ